MQKDERALLLVRILHSYAPNDEAKAGVLATFDRMVNNKEPGTVIEKQLINALADGINHGNWPWVKPTTEDYQGTFGNEGDVKRLPPVCDIASCICNQD